MKALLIEDEEHKINDLSARLEGSGLLTAPLTLAKSVRQAVLQVSEKEFDLIVLDMALPTFSKEEVREGGVAQPVGGVEVLRTLQVCGRRAAVIIVTQYPDLMISGTKIRLSSAGKSISKRYDQNVLGAVLYSFNERNWGSAFDQLLEKLQ
jgi:CheY-like chemotaxis protein